LLGSKLKNCFTRCQPELSPTVPSLKKDAPRYSFFSQLLQILYYEKENLSSQNSKLAVSADFYKKKFSKSAKNIDTTTFL
jgi:hypothetical protein